MKKLVSAVLLLVILAVVFAACMTPENESSSTTLPSSSSTLSADNTQQSGTTNGSQADTDPSIGGQATQETQSTATTAPSQSTAATQATSSTAAPTAATQSTAATQPTASTAPSGSTSSHTYTNFTAAEKKLFRDLFGEVIPFLANNDYYLEEYTYEDEVGLNFYTYDNTLAEYNSYRSSFRSYTLTDSYYDSYGDIWYVYEKNDFYVEMSYYETDDGYCMDLYAYILSDSSSAGGNSGSSSGGSSSTDSDLITNDGKGLPTGANGVYKVDLTKATHVKDVTDQGYYLDGCPTLGSPGVLVIPVQFSDVTAQSKGYDLSVLKNAFSKNGATDYHSVYDYYYASSYGQLTLDITVLDFWFQPKYTSSYYQNQTMNYDGETVEIGDQMILNEALAYLEGIMDLSKFDSDDNGIIDSVVLINTLDIGDDDFHWAYRYWNIYTNSRDEYYTYDGVSANDYLWASYQFLHEQTDSRGNTTYDATNAVNTFTYIHEFGHILGADDYYDTTGSAEPMGGYDIMDYMAGDQNAFTKFNLGWVTDSRLVTTNSSVTLTLEDFSRSGDTIILANNWDPTLGAYQEYYILAYYRNIGLNSGAGGYFQRDGIVVYHVNASLYKDVLDGETYYDIYNNNSSVSSDGYGTADNLIEYVLSSVGNYTYVAGDTLGTVKDDSGNALGYTFTVDSLSTGSATITFTKR